MHTCAVVYCRLIFLCTLLLAFVSLAHAEDLSIVAKVDDVPLYRSEADYELKLVTRGREILPTTLPMLQAAVVQQLIDRQLVLRQLSSMQRVASEADVDQAVLRLTAVVQTQGKSLEDYLQTERLSLADLRRQLHWQLSWERYVAQRSTDENLRKFFDAHRAEFDGSERKVSHILWKLDQAAEQAVREKVQATAKEIRQQIASEKLTFATAAKEHSQAPSAAAGGDIGWIRRQEPMPEAFSKAVFELSQGEVSEPILTAFGWHLIQWTEEKPGTKTWQEVQPQLKAAIATYLFKYHAAQERKTSPKITVFNNQP